ncbi:hypothetical protein BD779DRAFT_1551992 [Infundibulicybe gibba]|nr:hypothetical protein BD779DRAFT_1551992 [Infundibulicybe gibba]
MTAGTPSSPPPLNYILSPYAVRDLGDQGHPYVQSHINPVLSYTGSPVFDFNLAYDPRPLSLLKPRILGESAITPRMPSITITCELLSREITIHHSSRSFVTVADVLYGLHRELYKRVGSAGYNAVSPPRRSAVSRAFHQRWNAIYDKEERNITYKNGLLAIDFLVYQWRFMGLSSERAPTGNHWRLHVSA